MKIAITQRQTIINGIVYDCLEQGWYRLFKNHELIIVPNLVYVDLDADMLVLTGGDNTESRFQTELVCYSYADDHNIPVLGVCHGAFMINYLHGGLNKEVKGHRNVMHSINMEKQTYMVNSYHDIGIYSLGDNLESIAVNEDSIEAFKHETKPIWGLVWHPERMEDPVLPLELKELING
jgi:gamma-glutamyl-gamma-aminobutyrate hydrolase PuuD